ncbi:MAG: NAD-binding protein, partial [Myxococcota bacterium]
LERVTRLRSRELFTMVAFLVVAGSAVIAGELGLTLSVGAFVGGLVLASTPWAPQLFAEVIPLRGLLLGVFFTAVGMLFEPVVAAENWLGVLVYAFGVIGLKAGFVVAIVATVLRQGLRLGILAGLSLAQTGEFSFVLAAVAAEAGLLDADLRQIFVAGSIVTLVATPFLVAAAPGIAARVARRSGRSEPEASQQAEPGGHVVLVGFGLAGQNLARVLKSRAIPYRAVEANAATVGEARTRGEPVIYGDAGRREILEHLGVPRAALVIVVLSDPITTRDVVRMARGLSPETPVLARTRYVLDVDELQREGATSVVAEEVESTLELMGEMLQHFDVPTEAVARFTAELRDEGYVFLRTPQLVLDPWLAELLEEATAHWVEVPQDFREDASLAELDVRRRTGANIVLIERGTVSHPSPEPEFRVRAGDRMLAVGGSEELARLDRLLREPREPA